MYYELTPFFIDIGRAAWAWWIAPEDEKLLRWGELRSLLLAMERQYPSEVEIYHKEIWV